MNNHIPSTRVRAHVAGVVVALLTVAPIALAADPFGGIVALINANIRNWCAALALAGGAYLGMKWMFGDNEAPHQTRGYLMGALILAIVGLGAAGWTIISSWFNVS